MEETGKVPSALARARRLCVHVWRYRTLNLCDMCWRWEAEAAEKRAKDAEGDLKAERQALYEEALERDHFKEALAASQALTQLAIGALIRLAKSWHYTNTDGRHSTTGTFAECPKEECVEYRKIQAAALAESPDHVAPAPEAHPPDCGCPKVPCSDPICSCRTTAAHEATASPAPECECSVEHPATRGEAFGHSVWCPKHADFYERAKSQERMLGNLLSRIHRDGGQYIAEHGWEKATEDADARIVEWLAPAPPEEAAPQAQAGEWAEAEEDDLRGERSE